MRLASALCSGLAAYLMAGFLTGRPPQIKLRRRARPALSAGQLWLVQAGVSLTPRQFWAGSAAVGLAIFALVAMVTNTPVVAIVPGGSVAALPRVYFARPRPRPRRRRQPGARHARPRGRRRRPGRAGGRGVDLHRRRGLSIPEAWTENVTVEQAQQHAARVRLGLRSLGRCSWRAAQGDPPVGRTPQASVCGYGWTASSPPSSGGTEPILARDRRGSCARSVTMATAGGDVRTPSGGVFAADEPRFAATSSATGFRECSR